MRTSWSLGRNAVVLGAVLGLGLLLAGGRLCHAKDAVDTAIKHYEKVSGVDGSLNSIGSDTLNNLMTYWAESFSKLYPNVKIQVEGKGLGHRAAGFDRGYGPAWTGCRGR